MLPMSQIPDDSRSHGRRRSSHPSLGLWLSLILGLTFVAGGLAGLAGSYFTYRFARARLDNWVRTSGVIVALHEVWSKHIDALAGKRGEDQVVQTVTYVPEVEFALPSGGTRRFRASVYPNSPDYEVGQQVPVLYNPQNPSQADINAFWNNWLGPIVLLGLGLGFLLSGSVLSGYVILAFGDK
jgi:hypothetical protein